MEEFIKMKNQMTEDEKRVGDKIHQMFAMVPNKESLDTFIELILLPDKEFDAAWLTFKPTFENLVKSEKFQEEQRNIMNSIPELSADAVALEREENQKFIDEICAEPSLSANKKEFIQILFGSIADIHEQLIDSNRTQVEVKIVKLNPDAVLPTYAHSTDAGADVSAVEEVTIQPGETKIVKTGIAVAIPAGYEIQIRPRSGLSVKTKLRIPNAPGTIDTEYRGEIGVPICNTGDIPYAIEKGMKVAQMLIAPTPMIKWKEVATTEELGATSRGKGGFGSTDKAANAG